MRAVLKRIAILDDHPSTAVDCEVNVRLTHGLSTAHWPSVADAQYFDSELRLAFMCLLVMKGGPLENRHACARRAAEIYLLLNDWVRCNGGNAGLEQRLARLRWHLDALPDIDVSALYQHGRLTN